ncbi:bifunctional biotin--[acetyl-CoA-carboxylase] synthetase/biotin operon repressor [Desulfosarcina alkanivorans]|jgi:BirA family biotin operon repressor/biotin-[acetyl-CoA-carboxylase] ligase|uniref:Bifunctional ligase/repressor BirA n=1 Tax=Desulfosarcina alkanivorans TaxID=571177 RepID=A0A5K7Y9P8_9BACT|nr:biotin--[acetyl-CoA-carboxylase] ligase [Desulfosarcina alkanivorans]BBO66092.1 bifunctional biotin--[acetyl-CoA-carboxylase] synthetase/biotin operon repressor [Desulfosarcina alkanivorans]
MDAKQKIVTILSQARDVVSGETLSTELGVSRVSVWKHIKGLVQSGIPIVSSPKGYCLPRDPDCLMPWAFDEWRDRIRYFPETTSTMDEAMSLARKGCPDFTVAVAQRQTCGRGRMKRIWLSADGGLYFTVVVRPDIPIMMAGLVNLAAALDMTEQLRALYHVDAHVKWPNDILVGNHKICGVLSQMEAEGDQVAHMNIGVGLNVNNAPETEEPIAVSLRTLMGRTVPRREILTAFLEAFERRIRAFDPHQVIDQWQSCNVTLGRKVRVFTVKDRVEGTAEALDEHGGLVLRLADGSRRTVVYGDCFHR